MRAPALAISIWMFICMTVLGVVGYTYVLWSQYWRTVAENQHFMNTYHLRTTLTPSRNNDFMAPIKRQASTNSSYRGERQMTRLLDVPQDKLLNKINTYKSQLIIQFRRSQMDRRNPNFHNNRRNHENRYKVHFKGKRTLTYRPAKELTCRARKEANVEMLDGNTEPFRQLGFSRYFPKKTIFESLGRFNQCAIVASAGSMAKSKLGKEIDSHDAILRFNTAPTESYEDDVGSKTTIRFLNSQVVSKPEFDFFESSLYRNVTLVVWDPSLYHGSLDDWYQRPDFDLFSPYWLRRKLEPQDNFYILNPHVVWETWDFIQRNTPLSVEHNPPSSGFLGILLMLKLCNSLDIYEYVPSMRLTKQCHYFDVHEDIGCTFGDWHPLSSEKLLALAMNTASDVDIFQTGKVTLRGFRGIDCSQFY